MTVQPCVIALVHMTTIYSKLSHIWINFWYALLWYLVNNHYSFTSLFRLLQKFIPLYLQSFTLQTSWSCGLELSRTVEQSSWHTDREFESASDRHEVDGLSLAICNSRGGWHPQFSSVAVCAIAFATAAPVIRPLISTYFTITKIKLSAVSSVACLYFPFFFHLYLEIHHRLAIQNMLNVSKVFFIFDPKPMMCRIVLVCWLVACLP